MKPALVVLVAALAACSEAPQQEPPPTFEEQSLLALQHFYADDAEEQMLALRAQVEEQVQEDPQGFAFRALTPDDVDMYEHDEDHVVWERTGGAGVIARMRGEMPDYVAASVEPDQSFVDSTYDIWTRAVTDGDADAFLSGDDDIDTQNHIQKTLLGVTIPYDMEKDFRWYGDTLTFISLVPQAGFDESGDNGIVVGFTVELWYEDDEGLVWFNASWSQIHSLLEETLTLEQAIQLLIDGTLDYYWGTEEHVTGTPHEG